MIPDRLISTMGCLDWYESHVRSIFHVFVFNVFVVFV